MRFLCRIIEKHKNTSNYCDIYYNHKIIKCVMCYKNNNISLATPSRCPRPTRINTDVLR